MRTPTQLRADLDALVGIRRRASEAEAEHYREMTAAGDRVERAGVVIDKALAQLADLTGPEEGPAEPNDPAVIAEWSDVEGEA